MNKVFDAIIMGSGIAGLTAAIYLKEFGHNVLILTKTDTVHESNTNYAQGGIIAKQDSDTSQKLSKDILKAGCFFNFTQAVKMFSEEGPDLVFDFLIKKVNVEFSKDPSGQIDYTKEAAHSSPRILHYKDHTGEEIEKSLISYAQKLRIPILTSYTSIDIITNNHHSTDDQELYKQRETMGIYALNNNTGIVETFFADNIILATGGIGNLYQHTTNPEIATGDGLSMAYRAGADIINSEFIQFHPTSLFHKDIKRFLISESLRGEGAKLIDLNGSEFMQKYSDMRDLAPRDVVSRAIFEEMNRAGSEYMFLDLANNYTGSIPIQKRFPLIYDTCLKGGIDITKEPIPIVPAAHYFCGGVKVNEHGQTSLKNLYAIGEVSCTGLHGANRLASTSLLEGLLWGKKAAEHISKNDNKIKRSRFSYIFRWETPEPAIEFDPLLIKQDLQTIQLTMWNYAGIIRTNRGLERAQSDLDFYSHRIFNFYKEAKLNRNIIELRNVIINAKIIVSSAIHNKKSIGCHYINSQMQTGQPCKPL